MKGNGFISFFTSFILFTVFASAFSVGDLFGENLRRGLVPRQDSDGTTSPQPTATNSQNNNNNNNGQSSQTLSQTGSNQPQQTGTITGTNTRAQTATGSRSGTGRVTGTATRSNSTLIDPLLGAGAVQMLTPAPAAGMTFVKVGQQVTFVWNYTNVAVPPAYIDVVATNTINSQTYTIAANMSYDATQTVVWDTGNYPPTSTLPFVVATYSLMVYDAASNPTAIPSAGYLAAFNNYPFGVYTPQPYTPLNEFRCATCSGAMSIHEKQALKVLLGSCAVTVLSFTWFASGFGLF